MLSKNEKIVWRKKVRRLQLRKKQNKKIRSFEAEELKKLNFKKASLNGKLYILFTRFRLLFN